MKPIAFDTLGLAANRLSPPLVSRRLHHHQEIELNYLFTGGVTYLHRWRRRSLPLRRLVAFWGASPHCTVAVAPQTEMAWITVPLSWLWQWNLPAAFTRRLLEGEWCEEVRGEKTAERYPVAAWVDEIKRDGKEAPTAILLELQAAIVRMAAAGRPRGTGRTEPALTGGSWRHVETMAQFMATRFTEEIDMAAIASATGLHPKYALTLFQRSCGLTPADYLRQHRITHAQRLLLTTDAKVIDVALASGFASLSAFYESFQRVTRTTPAEFKRRGAGGRE